jgi:hypothetical protein
MSDRFARSWNPIVDMPPGQRRFEGQYLLPYISNIFLTDKQLTNKSHFSNDLGLDSLDTVEVVMAIEEA